MEPERKIEKLLRAYAKKRRAQAGGSLMLHPATRRILQSEATRRAPKLGKGSFFLLILATFRRRLAFAFCVVAIAFLGMSMFLPALSSAKRKAQNFSAANNLKVIGMATHRYAEDNKDVLPASLDTVTNALDARKVLIDPVSGKPFIYAGGGKKLDDLQSNTVLAYSPVNKNGHTVLFADGRVETVTSMRFTELTNQKSLELALVDKSARERVVETPPGTAPVVAATPVPALQTTSELESGKLKTTVSRQFVQAGAASNLQNLFRNASVSAQTTPVLQSFQVQQNGDAISVVDRDGSVYNGSVQPESATVRNEPTPAEMFAAQVAPPQSQTKAVQSAGNEQQAVPSYFFRVTGTNQTLSRNVVFVGNLLAISNAPLVPQQAIGGTVGGNFEEGRLRQVLTNQSQQLPWSNSRVVGTAVIDNTDRVEINAVPVTP